MAKRSFGGKVRTRIAFALQQGDPELMRSVLIEADWFLQKRLTEAALEGCHHCGEGDKGAPCHWCGLKN